MPRIWRHPFESHEIAAIEAGQKRQFRDRVGVGNSLAPGLHKFRDLDFTFARASTHQAGITGGIHCRVREGRPVQTLVLLPALRIGDVFYAGSRGAPLYEATASLLVTEVYPQRLRSISEREARLEGTAAAWRLKLIETFGQTVSDEDAYRVLLDDVGPRKRKHWQPHADDGGRACPRNFFALNYLRHRTGWFQLWRRSPWMWVIGFEWYPMRPAELIARLAAGTLERKRA